MSATSPKNPLDIWRHAMRKTQCMGMPLQCFRSDLYVPRGWVRESSRSGSSRWYARRLSKKDGLVNLLSSVLRLTYAVEVLFQIQFGWGNYALTKSIDTLNSIMCNAWYCQVSLSKNRDAWIPAFAGMTPFLWIPAGVYSVLLIRGRNDTVLWKPQCMDRHLIVLRALFPLTAWKLKGKYCINK